MTTQGRFLYAVAARDWPLPRRFLDPTGNPQPGGTGGGGGRGINDKPPNGFPTRSPFIEVYQSPHAQVVYTQVAARVDDALCDDASPFNAHVWQVIVRIETGGG